MAMATGCRGFVFSLAGLLSLSLSQREGFPVASASLAAPTSALFFVTRYCRELIGFRIFDADTRG